MIALVFALLIAIFGHGGHASPPHHSSSATPADSPTAPPDTGGGTPMAKS